MPRKPAILIILIFLLIGGGAVAFYFDLQKQTPEFSKVDGFLRTMPASSGWKLKQADERVVDVRIGPRWLRSMGIGPRQERLRTQYNLISQEATRGLGVIVSRRSNRVTDVVIVGRSAEVDWMKERLLEREPRLRPYLRFHAY